MQIVRSNVMTDELREKCIASKKLYLFRYGQNLYEAYKGIEKVDGSYVPVIYVHSLERVFGNPAIDIFLKEGRLKLVKSLSELYPESLDKNSNN